jgi:putative DNA primase/helicase
MTSHWMELEDRSIRGATYEFTETASFEGKAGTEAWLPNRSKIANLLEALQAVTHLSETIDQPSWIEDIGSDEPIVACSNGLLALRSRLLLPHDPRFFNQTSVPFAYQREGSPTERWQVFLHELWPDDPASIAALQEFFGYVVSGRLDLHKILLLVGPTRAGKGLIARLLGALIGSRNVAGPTLSSLSFDFGLAPLIGKPLAVVSDARLDTKRDTSIVVERLLAISGEDTITVNRKYREQWTGKLPTRFLIISNELPRLGDASAAIANRFVVLLLQQSWLGKEDLSLEDKAATRAVRHPDVGAGRAGSSHRARSLHPTRGDRRGDHRVAGPRLTGCRVRSGPLRSRSLAGRTDRGSLRSLEVVGRGQRPAQDQRADLWSRSPGSCSRSPSRSTSR